jgi:hypothetical protein
MGILQWIVIATSSAIKLLSESPDDPADSLITCHTNPNITNIVDLVHCLGGYTVPGDFYNESTYNAAQPTTSQRVDWASAVHNLLEVDLEETCRTEHIIPEGIRDIYSAISYKEQSNPGPSYCLLYEHTSYNGSYTKGWGFMLTRIDASRSSLHLSTPHPWFDGDTPEQAGYVLADVGAKSLLVAGRHRRAYFGDSPCIHGKVKYYATDPTHNNVRFSHFLSVSVTLLTYCL